MRSFLGPASCVCFRRKDSLPGQHSRNLISESFNIVGKRLLDVGRLRITFLQNVLNKHIRRAAARQLAAPLSFEARSQHEPAHVGRAGRPRDTPFVASQQHSHGPKPLKEEPSFAFFQKAPFSLLSTSRFFWGTLSRAAVKVLAAPDHGLELQGCAVRVLPVILGSPA